MDFFQNQEKARRKTKLLVVYFAICVAMIIVGVYFVVWVFFFFMESESKTQELAGWWWHSENFIWISLLTLVIVSAGSLYKIWRLSSGGKAIAEQMGGRLIHPSTQDLQERKALNVVEEMAIASGTAVPPVFLLEKEGGINAFAAGFTGADAAIGLTRGTLDLLNRDELQGVIAHEFSHIGNGDMRLNIRLMGVLHGLVVLAIVARILMRTRGKKNPLPLLGLLLFILGYIGIFWGRLIKASISREREFLADAASVQYTRNPEGLAGALKKIGGWMQNSYLQSEKAEEASHLFFSNALKGGGFATHPPLIERIKRLDPSFNGVFSPVSKAVVQENPESLRKKLGPQAGGKISLDPKAAVNRIGQVAAGHMAFAAQLVENFHASLKANLEEAFGARAVVFALLMSHDSQVETAQWELLRRRLSGVDIQELQKIAPKVRNLGAEARLPLMDMTLPALRELSDRQYQDFRAVVNELVEADSKLDLTEFVLEQVLLKHLDPYFKSIPVPPIRYKSFHSVKAESGILFSCLAHFGNPSEGAAREALKKGLQKLPPGNELSLLPRDQADLKALEGALAKLNQSSPPVKKLLLTACAACVGADGLVTLEEAEILRGIADALDCPMPPFIEAAS